MDGTLVDNMSFQYEAWRRFFAFHNQELMIDEVKELCRVGIPRKTVVNFFRKDLTDQEISEHLDLRESFFQDLYARHFAPVKGLHRFLRRTTENGIPLALATGSDHRTVNYTLNRLKIRNNFKVVVDADDVINGKPDPESYLLAAEKLKVAPQNCLAFEDSFGGIEAAHRAGMQTVALTTMHKREELQTLPGVCLVIDNYRSPELTDYLTIVSDNKGC